MAYKVESEMPEWLQEDDFLVANELKQEIKRQGSAVHEAYKGLKGWNELLSFVRGIDDTTHALLVHHLTTKNDDFNLGALEAAWDQVHNIKVEPMGRGEKASSD